MRVLITGSSGLIGSELVEFFDSQATRVVGLDNNMRADFFGPDGDTTWNLRRLIDRTRHFVPRAGDIRDRAAMDRLFRKEGPFDLVVHCAAQPSHDLAARRPLDDFDVNAVGTLNLLEATRQASPEAVFVLMSTNKVYGDAPNEIPLTELETRWEYARPEDWAGVDETMRIDRSRHSVFGASKAAADVMTQEYGRCYGMRTTCLRGGCLTGPNHSGVELHGFLSYLVKSQLLGRPYTVFGYKGKQVRDNIHSHDVARAIHAIYKSPRVGEVYNLGGGRDNSCSILEAFARVESLTGKKMQWSYKEENRGGDHICYISNLARFREHYPDWSLTRSLDDIFREIVESWRVRNEETQSPTVAAPIRAGGWEAPAEATPADPAVQTLALRETFRDDYWRRRDPIADDRLLWRAQSFASLMHLLPGQTILELGCGEGRFTRQLHHVSRGENPITAVTFTPDRSRPAGLPPDATFVSASALPGPLGEQRFDFVVAMDLLDERNSGWLLQQVHDLLKPGGQVLFYESNPWNPVLKLRRLTGKLLGTADPRHLLPRPSLYELMSEIGFIRTFAVYNDFVYRPLGRRASWLLRNLSILLENAPAVRRLAGSILVHAQRPPRVVVKPKLSLCEHPSLYGKVSVVIPCHNEEMNIGPLVTRLRDLYGDYLHEIIPVDDNSKDGTRQVIEKLAAEDPRIRPVFRTPPNGVGRAIRDGLSAATGEYVLSMDCDFQHLLPDLRSVFDSAAQGYDVVVGSRFSRHSVLLNYPFQKIVANRAFHLLAQVLLLRRFRDLTNNLKLMRREVVRDLRLTQPGFAVNAETGLQPLLMGRTIREAPIAWINRTPDMGASSFKLVKVGGGYWQVLWHLWRYTAFRSGPYRDLPRVGPHRRTWRQKGSLQTQAATDQAATEQAAAEGDTR